MTIAKGDMVKWSAIPLSGSLPGEVLAIHDGWAWIKWRLVPAREDDGPFSTIRVEYLEKWDVDFHGYISADLH